MLSKQEKRELLADARSGRRRKMFTKANKIHYSAGPSLDDYIKFLTGIQKVFGPFQVDKKPSITGKTKL